MEVQHYKMGRSEDSLLDFVARKLDNYFDAKNMLYYPKKPFVIRLWKLTPLKFRNWFFGTRNY